MPSSFTLLRISNTARLMAIAINNDESANILPGQILDRSDILTYYELLYLK